MVYVMERNGMEWKKKSRMKFFKIEHNILQLDDKLIQREIVTTSKSSVDDHFQLLRQHLILEVLGAVH